MCLVLKKILYTDKRILIMEKRYVVENLVRTHY